MQAWGQHEDAEMGRGSYRLGDRGWFPGRGNNEVSLFVTASRPALRPTQPLIQRLREATSPLYCCTPTPYVFIAWRLVRHRDNFTYLPTYLLTYLLTYLVGLRVRGLSITKSLSTQDSTHTQKRGRMPTPQLAPQTSGKTGVISRFSVLLRRSLRTSTLNMEAAWSSEGLVCKHHSIEDHELPIFICCL
jgi:hypothetical protein